MSKFLKLLTIFLFLFVVHGTGQEFLGDVQFNKINKATVQAYIHSQIENNVESFFDVKPSLKPNSLTDGFLFHEKEYIVKDSLSKVWEHYLYTNPSDAWNTGKLDFSVLFSKNKGKLFYFNDTLDQIETGQLIYLNLNLLKGIKKLATTFEIITIDNEVCMIEFSYVEDNKTTGKQQMIFNESEKGYTIIKHRSYYKSESGFRDKLLYPYFHSKITNSYHRNMKRRYKARIEEKDQN